jgi:hypothetical protein
MKYLASNFIFMNQADSLAKNMQKIAEVNLSSFKLQKIVIAELRSCGCGATFL